MVGRDGGFVSISTRRRRPWMISPSEIWSTPVKRVDRTSNASAPAALLPLSLLPPLFRVLFEWSDVGWKSVSRDGQRQDEVEEVAAIPSTRE